LKEPRTIILEEKPYKIRQFTLAEIEDMNLLVVNPIPAADPVENAKRTYERMRIVIAAALNRDHPDMTAEKMAGMFITLPEVNEAFRQILDFTDLVPIKPKPNGADQGEAMAVARAA